MNFLPICLNIENKKILIVGGGNTALNKANALKQYTNNITFLSKEFLPELLVNFNNFMFIKSEYKIDFIKNYNIVYACTNNKKLNERISKNAKKLGILVNVCDNPKNSDFISPAIYKKDNISIAITSDGKEVMKSIYLRDIIKEFLENAGL